jgi:hypothetical protein
MVKAGRLKQLREGDGQVTHEKDRKVMETVMDGIEKFADYYRGYLPHRRSLIPLTIALATTIALWLSLYLISDAGPTPTRQAARAAMHPTSIVSGQLSR